MKEGVSKNKAKPTPPAEALADTLDTDHELTEAQQDALRQQLEDLGLLRE